MKKGGERRCAFGHGGALKLGVTHSRLLEVGGRREQVGGQVRETLNKSPHNPPKCGIIEENSHAGGKSNEPDDIEVADTVTVVWEIG